MTVDRSIPFVDAYIHLYDLAEHRYGWLEEPGLAGHTALLGDYRMVRSTLGSPVRLAREFHGANVRKWVHVEADFAASDPVDETRWLETVAVGHGFPTAIVALCDLVAPDAADVLDAHMAASPRVRGVRMRTHPSPDMGGAFARGLAALAERGLSYELNATPGSLLQCADVLGSTSGLQVVVGHAGFPVSRDPDYLAGWRSEIQALARLENVACKVSGLAMVDHAWTVDSLRALVLQCIEAFGPDRILFGSNWPVDALYSTYLELVDAFRTILVDAGFSVDEQAQMLHRNAERIFRI